jgi:hypothetical protein
MRDWCEWRRSADLYASTALTAVHVLLLNRLTPPASCRHRSLPGCARRPRLLAQGRRTSTRRWRTRAAAQVVEPGPGRRGLRPGGGVACSPTRPVTGRGGARRRRGRGRGGARWRTSGSAPSCRPRGPRAPGDWAVGAERYDALLSRRRASRTVRRAARAGAGGVRRHRLGHARRVRSCVGTTTGSPSWRDLRRCPETPEEMLTPTASDGPVPPVLHRRGPRHRPAGERCEVEASRRSPGRWSRWRTTCSPRRSPTATSVTSSCRSPPDGRHRGAGPSAARDQQPPRPLVDHRPRGLPRPPLALRALWRAAAAAAALHVRLDVLRRGAGVCTARTSCGSGASSVPGAGAVPRDMRLFPRGAHRGRHLAAPRRHDRRRGRGVHVHQGVAVGRDRACGGAEVLRVAHPGVVVPHRRPRDRPLRERWDGEGKGSLRDFHDAAAGSGRLPINLSSGRCSADRRPAGRVAGRGDECSGGSPR